MPWSSVIGGAIGGLGVALFYRYGSRPRPDNEDIENGNGPIRQRVPRLTSIAKWLSTIIAALCVIFTIGCTVAVLTNRYDEWAPAIVFGIMAVISVPFVIYAHRVLHDAWYTEDAAGFAQHYESKTVAVRYADIVGWKKRSNGVKLLLRNGERVSVNTVIFRPRALSATLLGMHNAGLFDGYYAEKMGTSHGVPGSLSASRLEKQRNKLARIATEAHR